MATKSSKICLKGPILTVTAVSWKATFERITSEDLLWVKS